MPSFTRNAFSCWIFPSHAVIPQLKDLPDIEGDRKHGVKNLSILLGSKTVFWSCISLLEIAYGVAIMVGVSSPYLWSKIITGVGHAILALILWYQAKSVDLESSTSTSSFYLLFWKHCQTRTEGSISIHFDKFTRLSQLPIPYLIHALQVINATLILAGFLAIKCSNLAGARPSEVNLGKKTGFNGWKSQYLVQVCMTNYKPSYRFLVIPQPLLLDISLVVLQLVQLGLILTRTSPGHCWYLRDNFTRHLAGRKNSVICES
ncbi:hypothetical protein VNO77_33866 [Canavalia gladiata]|uniref:Uncharacterized protein n=1 Tax=Canavalia gladiata TaxID=3824 RepID=A0AAN9KF92_CANGL